MRVTYLTHDEVNASVAHRIAQRHGIKLLTNDIRQKLMTSFLVCDLDYLPKKITAWLLGRAKRGDDLSRVAVHSYRLRPKQIRALRRSGVTVTRRLSSRLLGSLRMKVA